jgi:hypothetical protein
MGGNSAGTAVIGHADLIFAAKGGRRYAHEPCGIWIRLKESQEDDNDAVCCGRHGR